MVTPLLPGDSLLSPPGSFAAARRARAVAAALLPLTVAAILRRHRAQAARSAAARRAEGVPLQSARASSVPGHARSARTRSAAKYGGKTIIIARFVPIVRTCSSRSTAGIGAMSYPRFPRLQRDHNGGVLCGSRSASRRAHFFGNLPISVKSGNCSVVIPRDRLRSRSAARRIRRVPASPRQSAPGPRRPGAGQAISWSVDVVARARRSRRRRAPERPPPQSGRCWGGFRARPRAQPRASADEADLEAGA